jgi:hypothetical protein
MINNQTVASIQALGGFDGVTYFNNGDTLIFLQQENYLGELHANDGWNLPDGSTVPGFLAHNLSPFVVNERAGIWKINISQSNIVTLSFVQSVALNDYVQINYGTSQRDSVVYYDPVLKPGNSVPAYISVKTLLSSSNANTRFDNYGTKFINNRDVYSNPESADTWLKFPKIGEFL